MGPESDQNTCNHQYPEYNVRSVHFNDFSKILSRLDLAPFRYSLSKKTHRALGPILLIKRRVDGVSVGCLHFYAPVFSLLVTLRKLKSEMS